MTKSRLNTLKISLPKAIALFTAISFCSCPLLAQNTVPTATGTPLTSIKQSTQEKSTREKLVQMALQNPNYEVADRKLTIARYQIKKAKGAWLGLMSVQGNLNEYSAKTLGGGTSTNNAGLLYPKYNINATIPFDFFSAKKNDVKVAQENAMIAQAEKNQKFREIRAEVLTKYEDYLLCQEKLNLQVQITQDVRTAFQAAEKDFQEGAIKQDEYTKTFRTYTDEKIKQSEALRNFNVSKLELEKMIGGSLEDVLPKNK